jgi:hypothetical protein
LEQRADVRRLVEVLSQRVNRGSADLAAAVNEVQQLTANNAALAAQLKAARAGQALAELEAANQQVGVGVGGWVGFLLGGELFLCVSSLLLLSGGRANGRRGGRGSVASCEEPGLTAE